MGMKGRCNDTKHQKYIDYGSRGIKICKRWNKFEQFRDDMYESYLEHVKQFGEKETTIDRENNNKGYNKLNCRWATIKEQMNNRRNTTFYEFNGQRKTIKEWSEISGIKNITLISRIKVHK